MPLSWLGWRFRTRNSASEYHGYGEGVTGSPKPPQVLTNGDRGPAALLPPHPFHNLPEQRVRRNNPASNSTRSQSTSPVTFREWSPTQVPHSGEHCSAHPPVDVRTRQYDVIVGRRLRRAVEPRALLWGRARGFGNGTIPCLSQDCLTD